MYPTSDLGLAAYLVTLGYQVAEVDKTDPRRQKFVFELENADDITRTYWGRQPNVDARAYYDSIKYLKDLLYA